ncbi:hypothetical protein FKZ61_005045 [Litorilinea aerophila]|uniref:Uncharacterized protein n=1 Tax=Litorilinea aerophila TaxID=1204385 RepID=A0A540VJP8_9CHLR|nr:hypothetical protein [Litorilinea aerophila]MCC9075478.1 hypothetical protein [Litorilinea aerophila]OUC05852.1 hypothetical protein RY27_24695 [Litorilinea aerophila]GIV76361.1 MAG: hypothetical protein KatS3mg050_0755 [Litorilinea sp.]
MKANLYFANQNDPVAVLDEVKIVRMNDNHTAAPVRIYYKTRKLNARRTMVELHRDRKLTLKLEDGRSCSVLLQHNSLDTEGHTVGVLRVLDELAD